MYWLDLNLKVESLQFWAKLLSLQNSIKKVFLLNYQNNVTICNFRGYTEIENMLGEMLESFNHHKKSKEAPKMNIF